MPVAVDGVKGGEDGRATDTIHVVFDKGERMAVGGDSIEVTIVDTKN
jgi:hypothetical protein